MVKTCEAQAMDFGFFGSSEPVPLCNEPGVVDTRGYLLCQGCADALEIFLGIAKRVAAATDRDPPSTSTTRRARGSRRPR